MKYTPLFFMLIGFEKTHLINYCKENNIDPMYIDESLSYYECLAILKEQDTREELFYNGLEEEDCRKMNEEQLIIEDIEDLKKITNFDGSNEDWEAWIEDSITKPKFDWNSFMFENVYKKVYLEESIRVITERVMKDKRRSWVRSERHALKTLF